MFDLEELAEATVQVESRGVSGSGFHFQDDDIVVTNHHVIGAARRAGEAVTVRADSDAVAEARIVAWSPTKEHDFAILRLETPLPGQRTVLTPGPPPGRGEEVAFAGFPHGIDDLLTSRAFVAGPAGETGFHLDATVNSGNSGGPIVNAAGEVVGIVTKRRQVGAQPIDELAARARALEQSTRASLAGGSVVVMGVNFGTLTETLSNAFSLIAGVAASGANAGLAIGFHIRFVAEEYDRQDS